jgi:hypothetical protein
VIKEKRKIMKPSPSTASAAAKILNKQFSLSFTSWFCLPDHGMKDFEVLCRASAFTLPIKKTSVRKSRLCLA